MADKYETWLDTPSTLGTSGRIVTPGASDLDPVAKAIVALTAGDVTIIPVGNANDKPLAFVGVFAGWVSPYRVRRVTAATATIATIDG